MKTNIMHRCRRIANVSVLTLASGSILIPWISCDAGGEKPPERPPESELVMNRFTNAEWFRQPVPDWLTVGPPLRVAIHRRLDRVPNSRQLMEEDWQMIGDSKLVPTGEEAGKRSLPARKFPELLEAESGEGYRLRSFSVSPNHQGLLLHMYDRRPGGFYKTLIVEMESDPEAPNVQEVPMLNFNDPEWRHHLGRWTWLDDRYLINQMREYNMRGDVMFRCEIFVFDSEHLVLHPLSLPELGENKHELADALAFIRGDELIFREPFSVVLKIQGLEIGAANDEDGTFLD